MQACARACYKAINTDFKRDNTPFVLSISQRSSEGRIDPPTHPDQIRVGQNTATLSQAVPAWLRPLSNIISHTLFQLSMNRVLWNRLLFAGISIIAVGVLYQLPPIRRKPIFHSFKNESFNLFHPWHLFVMIELTEIMRQKDDQQFVELHKLTVT